VNNEMLSPLPAVDYLLIGHVTADLQGDDRILGGTVSYAARTVSAFGLRVGVLTSADTADPLLKQLVQYTDELAVIPSENTSTFENIYTGNQRQQVIRKVAGKLSPANIPTGWLDIPFVHLAPLTGELTPVEMAAAFPDSTVLLTAQGLLRTWGTDGVVHFAPWQDEAALRAIDWLVISEEDIAAQPDLEAAYAQLAANVVITRAEKGGTYYRDGNPLLYDTPSVEVSQPTGAGDVFAAALLCSMKVFDGDVKKSLRVAAALGSIAVTRNGWDGAPTRDEVTRLLEKVGNYAG